ncbi:T-complex protein 1 subunit delta [Lemmus lemmus]
MRRQPGICKLNVCEVSRSQLLSTVQGSSIINQQYSNYAVTDMGFVIDSKEQQHYNVTKAAMLENVAPQTQVPAAGPRTHWKHYYRDCDKLAQMQFSNISVGKAVVDAVRTRLGHQGKDKTIQGGKDNVTIGNDGTTILKQMQGLDPAIIMLVEVSKAQDIEAEDGTMSVIIIAGSLS